MSAVKKIDGKDYTVFAAENNSKLVILPHDYLTNPVELNIAEISYVLTKAIFPYEEKALPTIIEKDGFLVSPESTQLFDADVQQQDVVKNILHSLAILKFLENKEKSVPEEDNLFPVPTDIEEAEPVQPVNADETVEVQEPVAEPVSEPAAAEPVVEPATEPIAEPATEPKQEENPYVEWMFSQTIWDNLTDFLGEDLAAKKIAQEISDIGVQIRKDNDKNVRLISDYLLKSEKNVNFISEVADFINANIKN